MHLTGGIPTLIFGVLAGYIKVWKLLLIGYLILLCGLISFYMVVPTEDNVYTEDNKAPITMPLFWIFNY